MQEKVSLAGAALFTLGSRSIYRQSGKEWVSECAASREAAAVKVHLPWFGCFCFCSCKSPKLPHSRLIASRSSVATAVNSVVLVCLSGLLRLQPSIWLLLVFFSTSGQMRQIYTTTLYLDLCQFCKGWQADANYRWLEVIYLVCSASIDYVSAGQVRLLKFSLLK